jgi:copper chaperone CopZ
MKRLQKPWLTAGILKSIKTKSNYFKLYKLGLVSGEVNRLYKNNLTNTIRIAESNFYKTAFNKCNNDMKKTWNNIKNLLGQNSVDRSIKSIIVNGREIFDAAEISEHFNNYFSTIATDLNNKIPNSQSDPLKDINVNMPLSFFINPVDAREVASIITNLKKNFL